MHGYRIVPGELTAQVEAISTVGEQTAALVGSANRLAERLPLLGTAPPALHLARRLREEAGRGGLTGEVSAAGTEVTGFHDALKTTVGRYLDRESADAQAVTKGGRR